MGQTNFLDHCPLDSLHGQIPSSKSYAAIDIVVPKGQFGISDTDQYEWEFPTHTRQLYRTSSDDTSPPSQLQQTYVIPSYLPVDKITVSAISADPRVDDAVDNEFLFSLYLNKHIWAHLHVVMHTSLGRRHITQCYVT